MPSKIPDPEQLLGSVLLTLRDGVKYKTGCTLSATGCALVVGLLDDLTGRIEATITALSRGAELPDEYVLDGPK